MDRDYKKMILDSVGNADMLLVGIGREWQSELHSFTQDAYIFDEKIKSMQLFPFFLDVLKKKWISEYEKPAMKEAYRNLSTVCEGKNYYVVTLCFDDVILGTELQRERIVAPCGSYKRVQFCAEECRELLSEDMTREIESEILDAFDGQELKRLADISEKYVRKKPAYNTIMCEDYSEEGYLENWNKYLKWLQGTVNRNTCVLELGVDLQFPSVIRWPFERIVTYNNKAVFYRIHEHLYQIPVELSEKGTGIMENSVAFLGKLFV